jgi:hypothetical protein
MQKHWEASSTKPCSRGSRAELNSGRYRERAAVSRSCALWFARDAVAERLPLRQASAILPWLVAHINGRWTRIRSEIRSNGIALRCRNPGREIRGEVHLLDGRYLPG